MWSEEFDDGHWQEFTWRNPNHSSERSPPSASVMTAAYGQQCREQPGWVRNQPSRVMRTPGEFNEAEVSGDHPRQEPSERSPIPEGQRNPYPRVSVLTARKCPAGPPLLSRSQPGTEISDPEGEEGRSLKLKSKGGNPPRSSLSQTQTNTSEQPQGLRQERQEGGGRPLWESRSDVPIQEVFGRATVEAQSPSQRGGPRPQCPTGPQCQECHPV